MAFTQSDVDAIKKAIASNVQMVRYSDGRLVQYRSVTELQAALAMAEADVGAAAGGVTTSYASFSRD